MAIQVRVEAVAGRRKLCRTLTLTWALLLVLPIGGCRAAPVPEAGGGADLGTASAALTLLPACLHGGKSVDYDACVLPEDDLVPWTRQSSPGAVVYVQGCILHVEATGREFASWTQEEPGLREAESFSVAAAVQVDLPPSGTPAGGAVVDIFDGERVSVLRAFWRPDPVTGVQVGELSFLTAGGFLTHAPVDLSVQRRLQVEVSRAGDAVVRMEGVAAVPTLNELPQVLRIPEGWFLGVGTDRAGLPL